MTDQPPSPSAPPSPSPSAAPSPSASAPPSPSASPSAYPSSSDVWSAIDDLWKWLEADRPHGGDEGLLLRMLKLSEEVGEVAEAVIGAMGQNPRKGVSHTWEDVQGELCDVVITALVALRTLTPDTREVFTRHLAKVTARSAGPSAAGH